MKKQTAKLGFTLVEIMIVVAIIGLLAAIAIPNFVHARDQARKNACIANLKQLDGAAQQWALENKMPGNATVANANVQPFLKGNVMPIEPSGADYTMHSVDVSPTCGADASLGHSIQ